MKPKAALVKDGFLPPGSENKRGRLSGAAIERCKELAATGWDIEGYTVQKTSTPEKPVIKKETPKPDANVIVELAYRYAEDEWKAVDGAGKEYGMREVDQRCGYSLVGCFCEGDPIVLGKTVKVIPRA